MGLMKVGEIAASTLQKMSEVVSSGITTKDLDLFGASVFGRYGARSAPRVIYGFPGFNLISINDEVVHGIPADRIIRPGDVVKIDVTIELDGYIADTAATLIIPPLLNSKAARLVYCAEKAFYRAMKIARHAQPISLLGKEIEREVQRNGFSVIRELSGHGVGRKIHEEPEIPNYRSSTKELLREGMVITVEPIVCTGSGDVSDAEDGWTVRTSDGSLAAHYEHTIIITRKEPIIVTAG